MPTQPSDPNQPTDIAQAAPDAEHQAVADSKIPAPDTDWLIQNLVALANNINIEMGLTLFYSGGIVSGQLISGARYFDEISRLIHEAEAANVPPGLDASEEYGLAPVLREYGKVYDRSGDPDDLPEQAWQPFYIHLRDARFFAPGQTPIPETGVYWRGRISEITGVVVGQMQAGPPRQDSGAS